jgi:lipid-A-disaccharide synthase
LPGSRRGELRQHLPVLLDTVRLIRRERPARFRMVLPDRELADLATPFMADEPVEIVVGDPGPALRPATIALSKTGTITMELAMFGVPAITFYKTSAITYWLGRQLVTVPWLSMPNLLANEPVFPEFVQSQATGATLARAALELLESDERRATVKATLRKVVDRLGAPGASARAARAVFELAAGGD